MQPPEASWRVSRYTFSPETGPTGGHLQQPERQFARSITPARSIPQRPDNSGQSSMRHAFFPLPSKLMKRRILLCHGGTAMTMICTYDQNELDDNNGSDVSCIEETQTPRLTPGHPQRAVAPQRRYMPKPAARQFPSGRGTYSAYVPYPFFSSSSSTCLPKRKEGGGQQRP